MISLLQPSSTACKRETKVTEQKNEDILLKQFAY